MWTVDVALPSVYYFGTNNIGFDMRSIIFGCAEMGMNE